MIGRALRMMAALGVALAASACLGPVDGVTQSPRPVVRPDVPVPQPAVYVPSDRSQTLRRFYTRIENDLQIRGLMRTDGGGIDTPYTDRMVTDNFLEIALFDEHPAGTSLSQANPEPIGLRRWGGPVRIGLIQGDSVSPQDAAWQKSQARRYAARLGRVTNHPITYADRNANFHVLVLDDDERRQAGPLMRELLPRIDTETVTRIETMPRNVQCLVVAFFEPGADDYTAAFAVLRSEHPRESWRSCLHEEVAQGLGLPNDSDFARPSIFNEDEEFALLTSHDEVLLQILYDPRLRPGIMADEARPIVARIAAEKLNNVTDISALPGSI